MRKRNNSKGVFTREANATLPPQREQRRRLPNIRFPLESRGDGGLSKGMALHLPDSAMPLTPHAPCELRCAIIPYYVGIRKTQQVDPIWESLFRLRLV